MIDEALYNDKLFIVIIRLNKLIEAGTDSGQEKF